MESPLPLFRPAAVAARRNDGLGAIVLARPVSFTFMSGFLAALACGLLALGYFGRYTAHSTLRGRLVPERGVIDIASSQAGAIVEKRVVEGRRVAAGEVLFVVSSERLSRTGTATQEAIAEELLRRRRSLAAQIDTTHQLERTERVELAQRRAALRTEDASLERALAAQHQRLAIATEAIARYAAVRTAGFLSEEQWTLREAELLEQRSRVENLERERAVIARLLAELDGRAATLGPQYANAIAELERAVGATDLEIVENDAQRAVVLAAPQAGTVTGVVGEVGYSVERGAVLARVVPLDPVLVAELLAPSRAVGFLAAGKEVRLRYAAFPYQKFGHARGTVVAISQATLAAGDAAHAQGPFRSEPVYRVAVALDSQTMKAYGEAKRLLPGMEVEADALLDTRRLYEWVLEPLYALAGRTG
jgi:membrane fusion protein